MPKFILSVIVVGAIECGSTEILEKEAFYSYLVCQDDYMKILGTSSFSFVLILVFTAVHLFRT